jgi:hypothetical protein
VRRRLLPLLALVAALAAPGLAHADQSTPGNNTDCGTANCAVAINQTDNSSLFAFAFEIRHVLGDVVDQENAAVAISSCTSCQTTAIAIQIVLVEGNATTVSPQNAAAAANDNCTLCDTFASAYQFVVGTNGPVRFTHSGWKELHDIRKEIERWGKQQLSNDEIKALLPDVVARIQHILDTQLVPVRQHEEQEADEHSSSQNHDGQPNAPPGETATTQTGQETTTTTTPTGTDTTPGDTTTTGTTGTTTTTPATTPTTTTTGTTTTTPTTTGP